MRRKKETRKKKQGKRSKRLDKHVRPPGADAPVSGLTKGIPSVPSAGNPQTMKNTKWIRGEFLFHSVHGLCRVDRITETERGGKRVPCYSLVPKVMNRMKVRFVVAAPDMEASGFHRVVSAREAKKILVYLKTGKGRGDETAQAWICARNILSFSRDKLKTRDQRKRQLLDHSVRGLAGEIACAFKLSVQEAVSRIVKSLAGVSGNDPQVLASLERAADF